MSKKINQLEQEKKEALINQSIEKKKKERYEQWIKDKNEELLMKKKKKEEEKKEEELKKEKQKQMNYENFKAWCMKKNQEKENCKNKNFQEINHIIVHSTEWIGPTDQESIPPDPNSVHKSNSSINSSISKSSLLYRTRSLRKSRSKNKSKSRGLLSRTMSTMDTIYGNNGLIINYKDHNLFTDSEKQLFSEYSKKKSKDKKKKNGKSRGSYGDGIYGDYNKNAVATSTTGKCTSSVKKSSSPNPNNKKNINAPPSLFDDYKKYQDYPNFQRKYPLLIGNAGLEMLLLQQKELQKEEKEKGIPSKFVLTHQIIQITGKKDNDITNNMTKNNNISFNINTNTENDNSTIKKKKKENNKHLNEKSSKEAKKKINSKTSISSISTSFFESNSTISEKRNTRKCNRKVPSRKNSISSRRNSIIASPKNKLDKPIEELIDPSLLQFLIKNHNIDNHEMCQIIKNKLLEDHVSSIISNNDNKTSEENFEELLNSSYHTNRQRLSDLFQNKIYLENLLKVMSLRQ